MDRRGAGHRFFYLYKLLTMKLLYTTIGLALFSTLNAQNFDYAVSLQEVVFSGDDMYEIRQDDNTGFIDTDFHWKADGSVNPTAFPSGTTISAAATIQFECEQMPASIYIRGTGPDEMTFPSLAVAPVGDIFTYPETPATAPFEPETIRFYEHFTINWEFSFDNVKWYTIGESMSPVYVTLQEAKPEGGFSGFKYYLTVFDVACRNADGVTTTDEMINKVWEEFTDHTVYRADGVPMGYYKELFSPNVTLGTLIKYADGECYTWAQLFLAALKIHGFSQPNNYMNITADYSSTGCGSISRFLVKDWTFGTPSYDCFDMPYLNVYNPDYYDADTAYIYDYAEVTDEIGVMGQTAPNPASSFSNHQIAIVNGKYYDASYGVLFNTFSEIKYGALSGWSRSETSDEVGIGIDVNGDGDLDASPDFTILRATDDIEAADFDQSIETW